VSRALFRAKRRLDALPWSPALAFCRRAARLFPVFQIRASASFRGMVSILDRMRRCPTRAPLVVEKQRTNVDDSIVLADVTRDIYCRSPSTLMRRNESLDVNRVDDRGLLFFRLRYSRPRLQPLYRGTSTMPTLGSMCRTDNFSAVDGRLWSAHSRECTCRHSVQADDSAVEAHDFRVMGVKGEAQRADRACLLLFRMRQ